MSAVSKRKTSPAAPIDRGGDVRERLARIEARMEFFATKEDIKNLEIQIRDLKIWVLAGIASALGIALVAFLGLLWRLLN